MHEVHKGNLQKSVQSVCSVCDSFFARFVRNFARFVVETKRNHKEHEDIHEVHKGQSVCQQQSERSRRDCEEKLRRTGLREPKREIGAQNDENLI